MSAPANTFIFGRLTDGLVDFGSGKSSTDDFLGKNTFISSKNLNLILFKDAIAEFAIYNSAIGLAVLIISYISITTFNYAAHRQIFRIRDLYLRSALYQDIGWYDLNNTGDFASRMSE